MLPEPTAMSRHTPSVLSCQSAFNKFATNLLSQKREYINGEQQTLLALQNQVQHPIPSMQKCSKCPNVQCQKKLC